MLKQELQSFLTDTVGVDLEQLKTALTSDNEVDVKFKSGMLLDDDKLNSLKETVKKEGYNEGKVTGVEMEAKRVKEKFGIDVEGKNFDNILDQFQKQTLTSAKIEPNKKVDDLTKSLQNLQNQYETDIGLKDKSIQNLESTLTNFKLNSELTNHVPDGLTGVNMHQFVTLAKTDINFDYDNGQLVAKKGDTILKDKMENPIPVKDVLTEYATRNGWVSVNGRGAGDNNGSGNKFESINDVYRFMEQNQIDPMSPDGKKLIADFNNK